MRLKLALALVALAGIAAGQVWEKPIAPGLVYRMEIDPVTPRIIHALRFSPGSPTKAMAELAGKTVYEETQSKGRSTVSEIVAAEGAIAGLNGDFFPYTGDPLGAMVRSGELVSIPSIPRATFGWSNERDSGVFGILSFQGTFQVNGNDVSFDNLNGECPANGIAVNTEAAGYSLCKTPNVQVIVRVDRADFSPGGTTTGVVQGLTADDPALAVQKGSFVIVAQGTKTDAVAGLRPGDKVTLRYQSTGIDFRKVDQLIAGGPYLIRDGNVSPDAQSEKFKEEFWKKRHPRSAVGKTANGDFWFVAVDGRSKASDGATIQELAQVMFRLGCRDAINLDGGGSTDMNILGTVVNRPSDGLERPVANAILFFGSRPPKTENPVAIDGPATVDLKTMPMLLATESKRTLGDADVLWACQGAAWIDQGGRLHPLSVGTATVTAWIKGQIATKTIVVTGKPDAAKPSLGARGGDRGGRKKSTGGRKGG